MSEKKNIRAFRLAFRAEGQFVNCYVMPPKGMNDAIFIGSILLRLAENEALHEAWIEFMKRCFATMLKEAAGIEVANYEYCDVPENERSGNA